MHTWRFRTVDGRQTLVVAADMADALRVAILSDPEHPEITIGGAHVSPYNLDRLAEVKRLERVDAVDEKAGGYGIEDDS